MVLGKTLESPLDCKEIQPVPPKGDQSWVFIGRTDAETETPVLWPSDTKSRLIGKNPDPGKAQIYKFVTFLIMCLVKAMVFPVVMYGCESWTIKKAEH